MTAVLPRFTMADVQTTNNTNMDYLHAPLDFENGFGFSPATSPARDGSKNDFSGGYFSNALNDALPFFDQNDGELFSNYTSLPPLPTPGGFSSINSKVVHGQVTPPSDNSPVTPKQELDNEPTPVSLDEPAIPAPPSRKKRASQAAQGSTPGPTKRRKTSGGRKASTDSLNGGDLKDEKRSKFLERNRVAASKCRQKKKEWTSNLEQKARDLQANKTHLSMLVNSLREEVLYLKSEVLKHDNCNCAALRTYMSRSVTQITGEAPPSEKTSVSNVRSPVSDFDLDGMSFTGSPQLSSDTGSPDSRAASLQQKE